MKAWILVIHAEAPLSLFLSWRLKLYDEPPSSFAFAFNLRRYIQELLDEANVIFFEEMLGLCLESVGEGIERQLQALHPEDGHSFPVSVTLVRRCRLTL